MSRPIRLESLLIGAVKPIGPKNVLSGIDKVATHDSVYLTQNGFEGDEQGDRKRHGGPDKAVHHYDFDHYATWMNEIGVMNPLSQPGAFGENLSTTGLNEANVSIGDVFRLGSAVIEVSQGRQPCWKLNTRFNVRDMAQRVQKSGRTGWYYRVIEAGHIRAGDFLEITERKAPEWTIERLWRTLYVDTLNWDELTQMARLSLLPDGWRRYAERRLLTRRVEDWSARLTGNSDQKN